MLDVGNLFGKPVRNGTAHITQESMKLASVMWGLGPVEPEHDVSGKTSPTGPLWVQRGRFELPLMYLGSCRSPSSFCLFPEKYTVNISIEQSRIPS